MLNNLFLNVRTNFYFKDEKNNVLKNLTYDEFNQMLKSGKFGVRFSWYLYDPDELVTEYTLNKLCVIL